MDFYIEKDKDLYGVNFFKDDIVHFEASFSCLPPGVRDSEPAKP